MKKNLVIVVLLIVAIMSVVSGANASIYTNAIPAVGYVKPDPVPLWMKQPCGTKNKYGQVVMNCYYDKKTMYQEGDSTHSYYQIRVLNSDLDDGSKMYCFVYWKHKFAKKNNFCVTW